MAAVVAWLGVLVPLGYFIVMCVVLLPGMRRQRRLSREVRRSQSWPVTARRLSFRERWRLARRTATGQPAGSEQEARLLVSRAEFILQLRQYLAERGSGPPWVARLLAWAAGFCFLQSVGLFLQLGFGRPATDAASSTLGYLAGIAFLIAAVYCAVVSLMLPRLLDRERSRLRSVIDRNGPSTGRTT